MSTKLAIYRPEQELVTMWNSAMTLQVASGELAANSAARMGAGWPSLSNGRGRAG